MFDGLKFILKESNGFDDPKEFDDPLVFERVSIGTMDFCIVKVNGDTYFFDGQGTFIICMHCQRQSQRQIRLAI